MIRVMRALLQRVKNASVTIDGSEISKIGNGFLIFLGIHQDDAESVIVPLVEKIKNLRVFEDDHGKMNLALLDVRGEVLVVSQFTLYADTKKGRRPSFVSAAPPEKANALYEKFVEEFRKTGVTVKTGEFQAMMDIALVNWGPVTILLDTKE